MRASIAITDLDDSIERCKALGAAGDKALAIALNEGVSEADKALKAEAQSVFDRPTPFTLNAFRIWYAKPNSLEAAIWVKDEKSGAGGQQAPEAWFGPQVYGGDRALKRSEVRLREVGILPAGWFVSPGKGARLDAYGNMSRGHMQQLLSGLGVDNPTGSTIAATSSRRSRRKGNAAAFFVIKRGKTPVGVAERRGKTMAVVLVFTRQPSYSRRFDFHRVVRRVAEDDALLESAIDRAILKVMSTR